MPHEPKLIKYSQAIGSACTVLPGFSVVLVVVCQVAALLSVSVPSEPARNEFGDL